MFLTLSCKNLYSIENFVELLKLLKIEEATPSPQTVHQAFKKVSLELHPDKGGSNEEVSGTITIVLKCSFQNGRIK